MSLNTAQYESSYFCRAQISTYHATREVSYSRSRYATTNVGGSALRWQIMATGRKTPAEPRSIPLWQLSDSKPKISLQQVRGNFNYRGMHISLQLHADDQFWEGTTTLQAASRTLMISFNLARQAGVGRLYSLYQLQSS